MTDSTFHQSGPAAFFEKQLDTWPEAKERFDQLKENCRTRTLSTGTNILKMQFNPARSVSAKAKTDRTAIEKRPCFLCGTNRPKEQWAENILPDFQLLVNPFPILPVHFTIVSKTHKPQQIKPYFADFMALINKMPEYILFYNGPACGASAPDHLHFQAGSKGIVPIEENWAYYAKQLECIYALSDASHGLYVLRNFPAPVFVIRYNTTGTDAVHLFDILYNALPQTDTGCEPMLNLVGWKENDSDCTILIFPRCKHRPEVYFLKDGKQILISPGALDMSGLIIAIQENVFGQITPDMAESILKEVSLSPREINEVIRKIRTAAGISPHREPEIEVGILSRTEVKFFLNEPYRCGLKTFEGEQTVVCSQNKLLWNGNTYNEIFLSPIQQGSFALPQVTIGINFHWQKEETQQFQGAIRIIADKGRVVFINRIPADTYLTCVICSEMNAGSPYEFLKASAVICRSWLFAQIEKKYSYREEINARPEDYLHDTISGSEQYQAGNTHTIIRWYERDDHELFDVCADDHCQRYQGVGRITSPACKKATDDTRGIVLLHEGNICDARFSKCCGGMTEDYTTCWSNREVAYLRAHSDMIPTEEKPLCHEDDAEKWIESRPACFCNTQNHSLLSRILNQYDQNTDFFRWKVTYTQKELSEIVRAKTGTDFGMIHDIVPLKRGPGGRLWLIRLCGSKCSAIIGKELEIRRVLSKSHLYSSAFILQKHTDSSGQVCFTFSGAGWGHGAGMCQIGAAVMGENGYSYLEILSHYYPHTELRKIYEPTNDNT